MATTTPRYTNGASGVGANSARSDEGFWNYAVPSQHDVSPPTPPYGRIGFPDLSDFAPFPQFAFLSAKRLIARNPQTAQDKTNSFSQKGQTFYDDAQPTSNSNHNSTTANIIPASVRSKPSFDSNRYDQSRLKPPVKDHADLSPASSENDSLLDLYKSSGEHAPRDDRQPRTTSRDRSRIKRKGSRGAVTVMEDTPEDKESPWIHRDKLAAIESKEFAEMGYFRTSRRPSRATSRKSVKTNKSSADATERDERANEELAEMPDIKRLRQMSPEATGHGQQEPDDPRQEHRPTSPTIDQAMAPRSASSRIPISTSSPHSRAVSAENGDSPIDSPRNRSGSNISYQKNRSRSNSASSQNLLNAAANQDGRRTPNNYENDESSPQSSPPKSKIPGKGQPSASARAVSANRKISNPQQQQRQRTTSNAANKDSPKRPGTSGGTRPQTARPEGEAPWIKNMYKPDPRLPPEEQMLPTHAKRMAELEEQRKYAEQSQPRVQDEYTLVDPSEIESKENTAINRDQNLTPPQKLADSDKRSSTRSRNSAQGSIKRSSFQKQQSNISEMKEKSDGAQWPLRTPSGHERYPEQQRPFSPQRPMKVEPEVWVGGKNGVTYSPSQEHGGYNLMPSVMNNPNSPHSGPMSPQSPGVGGRERGENLQEAPANKPVRLKEEKEEDEGKKKGGCGGCCLVM